MSKLIFCKFLNADGEPRGRDYTYKSEIDVTAGDYVMVGVAHGSDSVQRKKVVVTKADVNPADIPGYENFKDKIKTVIGRAPAITMDEPLQTEENVQEVSFEDL